MFVEQAVLWRPLKSLFFVALTAQAVLLACVVCYLGAVLFPGALTQTQRERLITLTTPAYAEAKWLDATLPLDAVVLEGFHYRALLPRPFVVGDRVLYANESNWKQHLTEPVKEKQITALITRYPVESPPYRWLATRYGTPLAGLAKFRDAARSPLNRGNLSEWIAIRINVNGPPA